MKTTHIDRSTLPQIEARMVELLKPLEVEFGLVATHQHAVYDRNGRYAIVKMQIAVVSDDGQAQTAEALAFRRFAPQDGIPADTLHKKFNVRGQAVELTGYNPKSWKMPYLLTVDGRSRKAPAITIQGYLLAAGLITSIEKSVTS